MDSLKRAMRWDEEEYGREYDLDLFMIVAVDDFNMGAMENKGLNIFNSKYVLASPETATDRDYELIEGIIAHEYFHNWTGNRITCRDWFQLCLKEGLTVYRDQQFSGDQRSQAVKRIADVQLLRSRQFREDAGPLAHPVRPESYVEINNFYTATVYEKGAEVIGMLARLVGREGYRRALDLYFERHDGQACTIEDWLKVFEDATGRDLTQFKLWYSQSGTPRLNVSEDYRDGVYTLTLTQHMPPTPGQRNKKPMVIPVAYGFLGPGGGAIGKPGLLELTKEAETFVFDLPARPVLSLLRGFSAPVIVERRIGNEERAFLLAHDTDPFTRWEAGRAFALGLLARLSGDNATIPDPDFLRAMQSVLRDETLDPAFRALTLALPSEEDIAQHIAVQNGVPDPEAVRAARRALNVALARQMQADLERTYVQMLPEGPYSPDAVAAGQRALQALALDLLTLIDEERVLARRQFRRADNMTQKLAALGTLVAEGAAEAELAGFYADWRHDRLVIDKWFAVQAAASPPDRALAAVEELTRHPDFEWKNPNRFRALIGAFAMNNQAGFHRADGSGYDLTADWLITLDALNPQTTARLCGAFETWRRYDTGRQEKMAAALNRIAARPGLSKDTGDIVARILAA
jgi:aminopeptidase N